MFDVSRKSQIENHTWHRAFTLIELLVVVSIMGLMAMLAVPMAATTYADRLDLAELQVRDAVQRAQSLARSTRTPHGVVFDWRSERFAVVDSQGLAVIDPLTRSSYVVDFRRPDQPRGLDIHSADFGSSGTAVVFDGDGLPITGGSVEVRCKGSVRLLTIDAATGQISSL